jgi:hypothetical protein
MWEVEYQAAARHRRQPKCRTQEVISAVRTASRAEIIVLRLSFLDPTARDKLKIVDEDRG